MISKKIYVYQTILLIAGILISAFGMMMLIKAEMGQSTVSGISYNIGAITGLKTGTVVSIINYICFAGQIIILRSEFKIFQFVQLAVTALFGTVLNFYLYNIPYILHLDLNNYAIRLCVLVTGIIFMSFGVSLMIIADLTILPFEGFCKILSQKLKKSFGSVRVCVDITFIIMSFAIIVLFKIPNTTIREGTVIYSILCGSMVNVFTKQIKRLPSAL